MDIKLLRFVKFFLSNFLLFLTISCTDNSYENFRSKYDTIFFDKLFLHIEEMITHHIITPEYNSFINIDYKDSPGGIIVRIKKNNCQAGCIGFYKGVEDYQNAAGIAAINALFFDPRFDYHLKNGELNNIEIQITILSEFYEMRNPLDFDLKKNTVLVNNGSKQAVLQNTIADEYNLSKMEFIKELNNKAGINKYDLKYLKNRYYKTVCITKTKFYKDLNVEM